MKILKDIPLERYDDTEHCYNYLNYHKTIGDEETDYNGIFHIHWRGPIDNDKIILQIKSILATQYVIKIYVWIENELVALTSPGYVKLNQFHKYVETKIFDKSVFDQAIGDIRNKQKIWMYYNGIYADRRYKTDIFRWIILSIYGGVYTDADTFLLRDVRDIRLKNWSSKWGRETYVEACILKLEKTSNIYEQIYLFDSNNSHCFNMYDQMNLNKDKPQFFNFFIDRPVLHNFTSLPCSFFDIVWSEHDNDLNFLTLNNFDNFFKTTEKNINLDNFLKGCFAYHWHSRWDHSELKDSYAGKLNQDLDKIIEEKYNIIPYKIFNK